jgi:hypothetical protein
MAINFTTLATEITTDPRGYGYRALISIAEGGTKDGPTQDQDVSDMINIVRTGSNPPTTPTADGGAANGAITIRKPSISSKEVWEAIDVGDMNTFPGSPTAVQLSTERRQLAWLTGLPSLPSVRIQNDDGTNNSVAVNLLAMFPGGSGTRTRLIALASRFGSRAEEKFGADIVVAHPDIAMALGR